MKFALALVSKQREYEQWLQREEPPALTELLIVVHAIVSALALQLHVLL